MAYPMQNFKILCIELNKINSNDHRTFSQNILSIRNDLRNRISTLLCANLEQTVPVAIRKNCGTYAKI